MHALAPETEYLCDLARAWASGIQGTVPPVASLDEDRFVRLLSGQPAMQTIVRYLDRSILPDAERPRLDRAVEISRRRTTMMLLELDRVLPALAENGCRPVVLKGAALALTVYDTPEDRWFVDLDLLVKPEETEAVYDVLDRLGYRFSEQPRAQRYYEKYHFHRILMSNQGVCIEVHWAVTMPRSVYRFDLDAMRSGASEVSLGAGTLLAPHAVDQILHGVLQSIPCGYSDLRRILDLHRLDAAIDDADLNDLCERAVQSNLSIGLWLQYRLRETILGHDMPDVVAQTCRPSPTVMRILEHLELTSGCLEKRAAYTHGYSQMLHWLCTPPGRRSRELRRYVLPTEEMRLQAELDSGRRMTPLAAAQLVIQRMIVTGRLAGHLARAAAF